MKKVILFMDNAVIHKHS